MVYENNHVPDPWKGSGVAARLALVLALVLSGCAGAERESAELARIREEGRALFAPGVEVSEEVVSASGDEDWGIAVGFFGGRGAVTEAERLRSEVSEMLGRSDVRIRTNREGRAAVLVGRYSGPEDSEARQDLADLKAMVVGGRQPFARAYLLPPSQTDVGSYPAYELVRAAEGTGAVMSLQIGVYVDEMDRESAKRSAEEAVIELRAEGEEAYYYHGRRMSMVMLGLFGPEHSGGRSPAVMSLRERFPDNLVNGERLGSGDGEGLGQPSRLMKIPDQGR